LTRNNPSQPPWDFLLSATRNSLQSYELSRLNFAANIGKEIKQLLDTYIEESSNARVARLLMEQKETQRCGEDGIPMSSAENIPEVTAHPVSDNFLQVTGMPKGRNRTMS
jgi:hypothetical protein